jgi:hypothetical protein
MDFSMENPLKNLIKHKHFKFFNMNNFILKNKMRHIYGTSVIYTNIYDIYIKNTIYNLDELQKNKINNFVDKIMEYKFKIFKKKAKNILPNDILEIIFKKCLLCY